MIRTYIVSCVNTHGHGVGLAAGEAGLGEQVYDGLAVAAGVVVLLLGRDTVVYWSGVEWSGRLLGVVEAERSAEGGLV